MAHPVGKIIQPAVRTILSGRRYGSFAGKATATPYTPVQVTYTGGGRNVTKTGGGRNVTKTGGGRA